MSPYYCCAMHAVQYMGMQSQQTQLVLMQGVLACTGQSVDQHKLANYYHAILSIILAQFSHKGFDNGMAGTVRLAQASPYIRVRSHYSFCLDVTASWHVEHVGVFFFALLRIPNAACNAFMFEISNGLFCMLCVRHRTKFTKALLCSMS